MADKHPYLPLYTGDWKKDPKLSRCTSATRGVWIDLLCAMHDDDRCGQLEGDATYLAILGRCSTSELVQALTEIQTMQAADVSKARNGVYLVINRRMRREYLKRKANRERQMRHRANSCHAPPNTNLSLSDIEIENAFEEFWREFPTGRKHSKGPAREAFIKALGKVDSAVIIKAARAYAGSEVGRGKFVKMPSTWLNQECWSDDPAAWRDKDKADGKAPVMDVEADVFAEYYRTGKFVGKPVRHATDERWWWAFLRDGTKVQCRNVPPRKRGE